MTYTRLKRGAISLAANKLISSMPEKFFTSPEEANRYMLKGDDKFSYNKGCFFTCGFGKSDLTPSDVTAEKYYIAGYGSNNPAENVLDSMYARALYIDDNTSRGGVVICAIDAVGMSRKDINDIRETIISSKIIPDLRGINICCTHTHSAIDTQGLWGEKITKTGRNKDFMKSLKKLTAKAIEEAYLNRKDGELFYSVKEIENMQFDCRTPDTYDSNLTKIHFKPFEGENDIYLINFASHAELLGDKTKSVSADFPCYMIREIEDKNKGADALFINGAIGGMISAKEIKKVYRNEIDCEEYTKAFGKTLGEIANTMTEETKIDPVINSKNKAVKVYAENYVLILARFMNVLNNQIGRSKGIPGAWVYSEVGYIELGDREIGMFLIPGELFPELFTGEFLDENESATGEKARYKILKNMGEAKHKFVVGLCNDELGYIIPDNDFYLNEDLPYIDSTKDKYDRKHYEETNSTGPKTARTILNSIDSLILSVK